MKKTKKSISLSFAVLLSTQTLLSRNKEIGVPIDQTFCVQLTKSDFEWPKIEGGEPIKHELCISPSTTIYLLSLVSGSIGAHTIARENNSDKTTGGIMIGVSAVTITLTALATTNYIQSYFNKNKKDKTPACTIKKTT